jgi:hypothetical protein
MVHFAHQVPTVPVSRVMTVGPLMDARLAHRSRPSWAVLFMKAYALVAADHPPLRRAFLSFPVARLYEHPQNCCSLAVERMMHGEESIFVGMFRAPELQTLEQLQESLTWYKESPLEQIGIYRQALRISRVPTFIRRMLWWTTLNVSGFKRAKRLGTFAVTSYGALGAEQIHPISPLSTTLTYGPIDPDTGKLCVKIIYDHRVLDGAYVARRLQDLEDTLHGAILNELRQGRILHTAEIRPPAA